MGNSNSTRTTSSAKGFMDLAQLAVFEMPDRNIEINVNDENNVQRDGVSSSAESSTECSYTTGTTGTTSSGMSSQTGTSSSTGQSSIGDDSSIELGSVSDAGSTTNIQTSNSSLQSDFLEDINQVRSYDETRMFLLISQAFFTLGFLYLLYRKLEQKIPEFSWLIILSPLMLCNLIRMGYKILELSRLVYIIKRYRNHDGIIQRKLCCFIRVPIDTISLGTSILLEFIDNLGEMITTAAIGLYLENDLNHVSLLIVLSPFWCEMLIGVLARCSAYETIEPDCRSYLVGFGKGIGYFAYKGLPAGSFLF